MEEWNDLKNNRQFERDTPNGWLAVHVKSKIFEAPPQMPKSNLGIISEALNVLREGIPSATPQDSYTYVHIGVKEDVFMDQRIVNIGVIA